MTILSQKKTVEATPPLLRLIEETEDGQTITITRDGQPIATIVPMHERRRTVAEAIEAMIVFGDLHTLGDVTIRETIEDGRRY